MDKQEIEHKLDSYDKLVNEIQAKIEIMEKLKTDIQSQLAEAEKPKLGHGDVIEWANKQIEGVRIAWKSSEPSVFETFDSSGKRKSTASPNPVGNFTHYFNVFDLMEGWDKDFKKWESSPAYKDAIQIRIEMAEGGIFFGNSGNAATFELKDIIEIWKQLGHAIISAKRSNRVCYLSS